MDDIERRLARVRPIGPPEELRDRITSARPHRRSAREWLLPIGAAAAAILLYALADRERATAMPANTYDPAREAVVQEITEQLGGGPAAIRIADGIVRAELAKELDVERR